MQLLKSLCSRCEHLPDLAAHRGWSWARADVTASRALPGPAPSTCTAASCVHTTIPVTSVRSGAERRVLKSPRTHYVHCRCFLLHADNRQSMWRTHLPQLCSSQNRRRSAVHLHSPARDDVRARFELADCCWFTASRTSVPLPNAQAGHCYSADGARAAAVQVATPGALVMCLRLLPGCCSSW